MTIQENISLKPYNTFGIDAKAKYFSSFDTLAWLEEILNSKFQASNSKLILGGGSNILLTKDFDGIVLKNEIKGIEVVSEDDEHVYIKAGAGENWHRFVLYCVNNNYAGVENLSLIPGNVGASPMQNIGAYGVEIKDVFYELEAFHKFDKTTQKFSLKDCGFGYRESVFKNKYKDQFVITGVTYRLSKKPFFNTSYGAINQELERMGIKELSIQLISQAVINIRTSKLPNPKEVGNAGSFFKNPVIPNKQFNEIKKAFPNIVAFPSGTDHTKLAAGWLIEQCGWKGYRKDDAGCYPKQALVLVNYGNATGEEIFNLSEQIIRSVKEKFGVALETEVNIL
ncbi:MAG TPA: UDP-N-acetylmuramate dehydrogenase [Flavisolibacter sp.]|nr:UDP-N-acetylmuramate dehydrogenase [Flavisolibacter sp.]